MTVGSISVGTTQQGRKFNMSFNKQARRPGAFKPRTAAVTALSAAFIAIALPAAASEYRFNYVMHSNTGQPFWGAVNRGMQDACKQLNVDCQMLFLDKDGDIAQEKTNLDASIAQHVDGIVTTIINDDVMDESVADAIKQGIPVIAANVDDSKHGAGNARLSFIGQDLEQAGYDLAAEMAKSFPDDDVQVVVNGVDLAQAWAAQRTHGIERFLQDYKKIHKGNVTWEVIEATYDTPTEQSRISAYAQSNPNLTAVIDVANAFPAALAMQDLGYAAGKVKVGGFDLVPPVMDAIKSGYQQVAVDQQPYLQGYLPIVQLFMMKKYNLGPWDVNTGKAMVTKDNIDAIEALSKEGIR
ncbi:substrate-binding domain-containing protein [Mesorhizobium sp. M0622]|uniref:substrate-binding domain-containing protein n=1 Tax=unclassified Mesorhizobium TaxID=325217 RepID=UPI00333DB145